MDFGHLQLRGFFRSFGYDGWTRGGGGGECKMMDDMHVQEVEVR